MKSDKPQSLYDPYTIVLDQDAMPVNREDLAPGNFIVIKCPKTGNVITIGVELITPEYSKKQIAKLEEDRKKDEGVPRIQRPVSRRNLKRIVASMRENWKNNFEALHFNDRDELINGQHRLLSIIKTGEPQMMLVVRGLSNDVMDTIDTPQPRGLHTYLALRGGIKGDSSSIVALVRRQYAYEYGGVPLAKSLSYRPTVNELYTFYEENKEPLIWSARYGKDKYVHAKDQNLHLTASVIAWAHYNAHKVTANWSEELREARRKEHKTPDDFFQGLIYGINLDPTTAQPIIKLRNTLMRWNPDDHSYYSTVGDTIKCQFIVDAWNKWIFGFNIRRFIDEGIKSKQFPQWQTHADSFDITDVLVNGELPESVPA